MAAAPAMYRDASASATAARWLLLANAAICLLMAGAAWSRDLDPARAESAIELVLTMVQLIAYAAAIIVVLRWVYLAHANARAIGAEDMMGGPGWAVAYFFIPLANLVMPVIMMRELWKASAHPRDWQGESASFLIPIWWGFWLASGLTGTAAFRFSLEYDDATVAASEILYFASDLTFIPAAILLERIISGVQRLQTANGPGSAEALRDRFA